MLESTSIKIQQDFSEVFDFILLVYENSLFLVEFQALTAMSGVHPDASIGIYDPVEGDCFLAIFVGFTEDTGNALRRHSAAAGRARDLPVRRHPPLGN